MFWYCVLEEAELEPLAGPFLVMVEIVVRKKLQHAHSSTSLRRRPTVQFLVVLFPHKRDPGHANDSDLPSHSVQLATFDSVEHWPFVCVEDV